MIPVALDFDGTCCAHEYPEIGEDIGAIEWLLRAQEAGARFILHTMRDGEQLQEARRWLVDRGVILLALNTNPGQAVWTASPKCYAKIYVDDAALGAPLVYPGDGRPYLNWSVAGPALLRRIEELT